MKLRIKGNSLRLRLTRSEVRRVGAGEAVTETIEFGAGARLSYVLEPSAAAERVAARFAGERITVTLPLAQARLWDATEQVGIYSEQMIAGSAAQEDGGAPCLRLMIEKDFACKDSDRTEDQSDAFPNPNHEC